MKKNKALAILATKPKQHKELKVPKGHEYGVGRETTVHRHKNQRRHKEMLRKELASGW